MNTLKEISLRFSNLEFISSQVDHLLENFFQTSDILKGFKEDINTIAKVNIILCFFIIFKFYRE